MESAQQIESIRRRAMKLVGVTLALYTVTVASHLGEFWPFSIYPMFSQAGKPWTRAMVLDVTDADPGTQEVWGPWSLQELPGSPVPVKRYGVSTNDLSKFVQLTDTWGDTPIATFRELLKDPLSKGRTLMLLRAEGRLGDARDVEIQLTGLVRFAPDRSQVNPALETKPAGRAAHDTRQAKLPGQTQQ